MDDATLTRTQRLEQAQEDLLPEPVPPAFSEEHLAQIFSERHADDLRRVEDWARWLKWDGTRWHEGRTLDIFDAARKVCREAAVVASEDIRTAHLARKLASAATVAAVERLARSDRRQVAIVEQWDAHPFFLNTPGGTIDLRCGEVREHRREDFLTKITAVSMAGEAVDCPQWLAFLARVTGDDRELQEFLQRVIGYSLTASVKEHALFFLYGLGGNGKTTFIETITGLMGDYAKPAPMTTFMAAGTEGHPTDLAGLMGARLVTAVESDAGRRWAEGKLKQLTGGDRIAARFMRQDFFEFTPQFKLIVAGNHRPGLVNVDEGISRRMHLIPFSVSIPKAEQDKDLVEKLRSEWPAILRWGVKGCLQWQSRGLDAPDIVQNATSEYLDAEDRLGRWLEERCVEGPQFQAMTAILYGDWVRWCKSTGEEAGSQKAFAMELGSRPGITKGRFGHKQLRGFRGVSLR